MSEPGDLLAKGRQALESARLLAAAGDVEGSADRAYYALFHAARALLRHAVPDQPVRSKTHASVIAAFGIVGVRGLGLSPEFGRLLNFAEDLRRKADYDGTVFADREAVAEVLSGADAFFASVAAVLREDPAP